MNKFVEFIKRNKMFFVALFIANPIAFLTNYVIYNPSSNQDKLDCILFSSGMSILIGALFDWMDYDVKEIGNDTKDH